MSTSENLADTAHELNNVLTVIFGSLEQLHRQPLDARGRAQLERAQLGIGRADRLVQRILGAHAWQADESGSGSQITRC